MTKSRRNHTPKSSWTSQGAARGRPQRPAGSPGESRSAQSGQPTKSAKPSRASRPASRPPATGRPARPISDNRRFGFAGGSRPYDYAAYEHEPATREYLARLMAQHGMPVSGEKLERFWLYYDLLRQRNAELDLTRIMGIEATALKHFVDSARVAELHEVRGPLLDIGSGPGFPGVPLAIMQPALPVILAESRGKRVGFLEEVVDVLGLGNVTIFPRSVRSDSPLVPASGRAPAAGTLAVRDVITRALETIVPTLERVRPFVPEGGRVLFMKGPQCGGEVTEAQERLKGVYKMVADLRYDLPASDQHRRLVVFERRAETTTAG